MLKNLKSLVSITVYEATIYEWKGYKKWWSRRPWKGKNKLKYINTLADEIKRLFK